MTHAPTSIDAYTATPAPNDFMELGNHAEFLGVMSYTNADGRTPWPYEKWASILVWQRYASPVWSDIDPGRTLQYRGGRDQKDEQHISPLQLDVIERCIDLWSAKGDVVLTPFLGIGSEVFCAVEMGRRGIGFELKPSYFTQAVKNLSQAGLKRDDAPLLTLAGAS